MSGTREIYGSILTILCLRFCFVFPQILWYFLNVEFFRPLSENLCERPEKFQKQHLQESIIKFRRRRRIYRKFFAKVFLSMERVWTCVILHISLVLLDSKLLLEDLVRPRSPSKRSWSCQTLLFCWLFFCRKKFRQARSGHNIQFLLPYFSPYFVTSPRIFFALLHVTDCSKYSYNFFSPAP